MKGAYRRCWRPILTALFLATAAPAGAETLDARYLKGLRDRRLFELAEAYCTDRLRRAAPVEPAQAELTVELIRTLSLHAAQAPPQERDALWNKARAEAAAFLRQSPPHPRAVLVRLQEALTLLAHGELARQELEATAPAATPREVALQALRQASSLLESLDKELRTEIPQRRRAALRAGDLSADELASLGRQIQHQLGRAQQSRALLFERGSDDRLSLLLAATDTLQRALAQTASDEPLHAAIQLDLATCHRLLGQYSEAAELASALDRDGIEPQTRLAARAELVRVALGQDNFEVAQRLIEDRMIAGQPSGELDFVSLEAYLAFAAAARRGQRPLATDRATPSELARHYERQAADAARLLDEKHGPYWGRRAGQLLISAVPRSSLASVELLSRAADNLYLKGDLDQAIAAYDDAAAQARNNGDLTAAFEMSYKAALIEQNRQRFSQAAARLRIVAKNMPTHRQAADAHLLAIWNLAQRANSEPASAADHEELLTEHLAMWPAAESANQARIWLGKLREASSSWSAATEAYAGVSRASPHYSAAIAGLARCWRAELAGLDSADKRAADTAVSAIAFFRQAIVGPENRWPQRWTEADRTAALAAAELIVAHQPGSASDAEDLLRRALAGAIDAPLEWKTAAQAQLVVALAVQGGRQNDALAELSAIGAASVEQMLGVLDGLSQVSAHTNQRARSQVARVQLAAVDMLAKDRQRLSRDQQLALDRATADALASAGSRDKALAAYADLATRNPDNGGVQEGYARLLLASSDSAQLKLALEQWRLVASRTKERTPRWYEAKYSVALAQFKLGDRGNAAGLLRYMIETQPGLRGSSWEAPYRELLQRCAP